MAQVEKKRVALATRVALYLRQRPIACFAFALVTGLVLGSVGLGMLFAGGVARDGFASADGVEIRRDVDSDKGTDIDSGDTDETEADGAGADGETGDSLDDIIVDVAGAVTEPGVFELERMRVWATRSPPRGELLATLICRELIARLGYRMDSRSTFRVLVRSCPRARLRADLHREMARRRRETEMRVAPS